jgi:very-short-patch-repair endonuclease
MKTQLEMARRLRAEMTPQERRLWRSLRERQIRARFRRQVPIGNFIVDFACFHPRVVIEVDGGQHLEQEADDLSRDAWLTSEGFVVLRFWNHEVDRELEAVLERIIEALEAGGAPPPLPSPTGGEGVRNAVRGPG